MERILEERVEELSSTKVKQVNIIIGYILYNIITSLCIANCYNDQKTLELVDCMGKYLWSSDWPYSRDSSDTGCKLYRKLEEKHNQTYHLCFECLCFVLLCS